MKKTIAFFLALMVILSVTLCSAEPDYEIEATLLKPVFGTFPQWENITADEDTLYLFAALAIEDVDNALPDSVFDFDNYDEVLITNLSGSYPMLIVKSNALKSELWFTPLNDISVSILSNFLSTDYEIEFMTGKGHYSDTRILDVAKLREVMRNPSSEKPKEELSAEQLFRNADSVSGAICGWFRFQYKDQGGYVNASGEFMTGWNFTMAFNSESGLGVVYRGNLSNVGRSSSPAYDESSRFGLIDTEGNEVLPCEYNKLDTPSYEGVYRVRKETSGKYQLFDSNTRSFVDLSNCDYVAHICDGGMVAAFRGTMETDTKTGEGKWGFIDLTGKPVIDFQYDNVGYLWSDDGYVTVTLNDKKGAIDRSGKLCIPCTWDSLSLGDAGFALAKRDEQYYVIDMQGTIVSVIETENAMFLTPTTLLVFNSFDDESSGVVDVYGTKIVQGNWRSISDYGNNYFCVTKKNKNGDTIYGIWNNTTGEMLIPLVYNNISSVMKDNRRSFEQLDYYGFMDESYKVVLPPQYEDANSFSDGITTVKYNGQWQIIDINGNVIY